MTLNPLYLINNSYPPSTSYIIDGNLTLLNAVSNYGIGMTHGFYSGKWYWEILLADKGQFLVGFLTMNTFNGQQSQPHNKTGSYLVYTDTSNNGQKVEETSFISLSNFNAGDGDIIGLALDRDNRKLWVSLNGTFINSGDPAGGSNPVFDSGDITATTGEFRPIIGTYGGQAVKMTLNAGQDSSFVGQKTSGSNNATDGNGFGDFYYTPPTGFLSANSNNVPTSTDIDPAGDDGETENPTKQFGVVTYSGTGSNGNAITGLGFQPDLLWIKQRNATSDYSNALVDSSRGRTKVIYSHSTRAELTSPADKDVKSFDSDGFTVDVSEQIGINSGSGTYVAWCWKANGGTTASNSDGSITTSLQVNSAAGFSIGTYTGTGSNATVGHGLGAVPDFTIFRERSSSGNWVVTSQKNMASNDHNLYLQLSNAESDGNYFQNTAMTSSVISIGTHADINGSSNTYVMYNWINVEGYQKFGTYTGNGNADGPFIYTGFRPALIFLKRTDSSGSWLVHDNKRDTFNPVNEILLWNTNDAEFESGDRVDFISNGFKLLNSNAGMNGSGNSYVYGAWGDVPFKYNNTF